MSRELVQNSDQIKEHQRTIKTLDNVTCGINTDVKNVVDQQNALVTKVDGIQTQVDGIEAKVAGVETKVDEFTPAVNLLVQRTTSNTQSLLVFGNQLKDIRKNLNKLKKV